MGLFVNLKVICYRFYKLNDNPLEEIKTNKANEQILYSSKRQITNEIQHHQTLDSQDTDPRKWDSRRQFYRHIAVNRSLSESLPVETPPL